MEPGYQSHESSKRKFVGHVFLSILEVLVQIQLVIRPLVIVYLDASVFSCYGWFSQIFVGKKGRGSTWDQVGRGMRPWITVAYSIHVAIGTFVFLIYQADSFYLKDK